MKGKDREKGRDEGRGRRENDGEGQGGGSLVPSPTKLTQERIWCHKSKSLD